MSEVGIYRVSGSASDLAKLKKSFESSELDIINQISILIYTELFLQIHMRLNNFWKKLTYIP